MVVAKQLNAALWQPFNFTACTMRKGLAVVPRKVPQYCNNGFSCAAKTALRSTTESPAPPGFWWRAPQCLT